MTDSNVIDLPLDELEQPRTRTRFKDTVDLQKIGERVVKFYHDDRSATEPEREMRIQRYAKYRMWTEPKDWPWPNASNFPLPDMMEKSARVQDTLHNAVMTQRPPVQAVADHEVDVEKEDKITNLVDAQFFIENKGEDLIGEMAECFVNDDACVVFTPWVQEFRDSTKTFDLPPIPDELQPSEYFGLVLSQIAPDVIGEPIADQGWTWGLFQPDEEGNPIEESQQLVSFYTTREGVEMVMKEKVEAFNGPSPMVMDFDDVLAPVRAANLQAPGPSNPRGASHVVLVFRPTVDEISRLAKQGFYDLIDEKDLENLSKVNRSGADDTSEDQKDTIKGATDQRPKDSSHRVLTLLICFDSFDVDQDGLNEDVIWWVILETKKVLKAKPLTEVHPASPPRRPLARSTFMPVQGRWTGIGLLQSMEGIHDATKQFFDQMADSGTLMNVPFFFYRQAGSMRPEVLTLEPGDGVPINDPQNDVFFPQLGNPQAQGFGLNMMQIMSQMGDKGTRIEDFRWCHGPSGSSTAMRTIGGMQLLAGKAEARPERILRRFFALISEVWSQIHELNQSFLPKDKEYRIVGLSQPFESPYQSIGDPSEIQGRFRFEFKANILNTNKAAMQQSLGMLMQTFVSDIALGLGIIDPQGIYKLMRDFGRSFGQDVDKYIHPPTGQAFKPQFMAEDVITGIMQGQPPDGIPAEPGGWIEHAQKLIAFVQSDELGFLSPEQSQVLMGWLQFAIQNAEQQALQLQALQGAGPLGQPIGGATGQPGAPVQNPPQEAGQPQVSSGNELLNETLPTAGGGAQ